MTVFNIGPQAVTADFHAGDVGYIKKALGHYLENTGDTDLVFIWTSNRRRWARCRDRL
jgi:oxalate decarboxylase